MSFLFGVIFLRWTGPPSTVLVLVALLALVCLLLLRRRWAVLLACVPAGLLWAALDAALYQARVLPSELEGRDLELHGRVVGLPARSGDRLRFRFQVERALLDGRPSRFSGDLRLYWFRPALPDLAPGAGLHLRARLKRPHGRVNPAGFDYEAWLFSRDIQATGYVRKLLAGPTPAPAWRQPHHQLRDALARRLASRGLAEAGIIRALLIGDRSGLQESDWELFRRTGTSHLMAISGLHIGMMALCGGLLGRWLWRWLPPLQTRLPRQHLALACGWGLAAVYAALAGFSLPTQRALLMLSLAVAALWLRRRIRVGHTLGAALLAILLLDPAAPLDAGFWLSFGAVAAIVWLVGGRSGALRGPWRWLGLQFGLLLAMAPLGLQWFQHSSLIAPLANALAIPWVGLGVAPLAMAGSALLGSIGWDAGLLTLADWMLLALRAVLRWLAAPEALQWRQAAPVGASLALVGIGLAWLLAPRGVPARWLGLVLCLPLLLPTHDTPPPGRFRLTLFDVGQGLSALVQTRNHNLLFDTGPAGDGYVAARSTVIPSLRVLGVQRLDRMIVSHSDRDHSGGAEALLAAVPVDLVQASVPDALPLPVPVSACRGGESWRWDGVDFELLAPVLPLYGDDNEDSCVLRVGSRTGSLLLTGDMGRRAEQRLVDAGRVASTEVLVAGHHGSNTSSSAAWLQAVQPDWVLYTTGYRNRYGFPHEPVRSRVAAVGAREIDTARSGAVRIDFGAAAGVSAPRIARRTGDYWRVDAPRVILPAEPRPDVASDGGLALPRDTAGRQIK